MRKLFLLFSMLLFSISSKSQTNPNPFNDCGIYAADAFTPNQDGVNDQFQVIIQGDCNPISYHLRIFDRYGRRVFESIQPTESWDGKYDVSGRQLSEGVYMWHLLANYMVPNETESMRIEEKGSIVLYR